jgi:dihydroxy-acid dehydratase
VGLSESVPVLTDGLPPVGAAGSFWASLAEPEAAAGGVIGYLRDGDSLRLDLEAGLIRTGVKAGELARRTPSYAFPAFPGAGYVARYARAALPALEGAGFG